MKILDGIITNIFSNDNLLKLILSIENEIGATFLNRLINFSVNSTTKKSLKNKLNNIINIMFK